MSEPVIIVHRIPRGWLIILAILAFVANGLFWSGVIGELETGIVSIIAALGLLA